MRRLLLLLAIVSLAFSETGYMKAEVEKRWLITVTDPALDSITLDGFFLANNSNQRVLSLETNGEAEADGELIKIKYRKEGPAPENEVYARAIVEINYSPYFRQDEPVPFSPIPAFGAANYTPEIKDQAYLLASSSSLSTVAALTDWVHTHVSYNLSYFGRSVPASEVFVQREGVCTEYTHLLISMLNSLGMRSRFVSGYVLQAGVFQPHAWAEVLVGSEAVPADPTFGETGAISASHLAMFYSSEFLSANKVDLFYGENRSEAFDLVNAKGGTGFDLSVNVSVTPLQTSDFPKTADLGYSYDENTAVLRVNATNPSDSYALLTYEFNAPPDIYGAERRGIVLGPKKTLWFSYPPNSSALPEGYIYTIPFTASVQGSSLNASVQYRAGKEEEGGGPSQCTPAFLLPLLPAVCLLFRRTAWFT